MKETGPVLGQGNQIYLKRPVSFFAYIYVDLHVWFRRVTTKLFYMCFRLAKPNAEAFWRSLVEVPGYMVEVGGIEPPSFKRLA